MFFSSVGEFQACYRNLCYRPLCQRIMRLCHKVNIMMQKKGDLFVGFVRVVFLTSLQQQTLLKYHRNLCFPNLQSKDYIFNIAKQKISSDPNTIKVSVVRVYFDLGRKVDIMRENNGYKQLLDINLLLAQNSRCYRYGTMINVTIQYLCIIAAYIEMTLSFHMCKLY